MKKLFTLAVLMLAAVSVNAQKTWTFESEAWCPADANGTYKFPRDNQVTIDGLTIHPAKTGSGTNDVAVKKNSGTYGDKKYTHNLQTQGSGMKSGGIVYRAVSFPVTGPCNVYVVAASGNEAKEDRPLGIGTTPEEVGKKAGFDRLIVSGDGTNKPLSAKTFEYKGEAGTLYLFSENSGINLYEITVTPIQTGIDAPTVATEGDAPAYNLSGVQVNDNYKGIVISNGKKVIRK